MYESLVYLMMAVVVFGLAICVPAIIVATIAILAKVNQKNTHNENSGSSIKIHTTTSIVYFGIALLTIPSILSNGGLLISFFWAMGSIIVSKILINKNKILLAYLILFSVVPVWLFYLQIYGISPYLDNLKTEEKAQENIQYGNLDLDADSYTPDSKNFFCSLRYMGVSIDQFSYKDNFDLNTGTGYLQVLNETSKSKKELNITYSPTNTTGLYIENFRLELNDWIDEQKANNPNLIILNGTIESTLSDAIVQSVFLPKETIIPGDNITPGTSAGYLTGIMFFKKGSYLYTFTLSEYQEIYFNPPQKEFGSVSIEHRRKADEIITKLLQYKDENCEFME